MSAFRRLSQHHDGSPEMASSTEVVVDLDETRVDFTELPPSRVTCSLCTKVLRNPHFTSCCSNNLCLKCAQQLESDGSGCPNCNEPAFTYAFDESMQQSINELLVRCQHVSEGCMWFGRLELLFQHMQKNCHFISQPCPLDCGQNVTQSKMKEHKTKLCKKRSYRCEHCNKYEATYEEAEKNHFSVCEKFPVACPNQCPMKKVPKDRLQYHVKNECLYQDSLPCKLSFAGCNARMQRKDLSVHIQRNMVEHVTLLCSAILTQREELEAKLSDIQSRPPPAAMASQPVEQTLAKEETEAVLRELLCGKEEEVKQLRSELQSVKTEKDSQIQSLLETISALRSSLQQQEERMAAVEKQGANLKKSFSLLKTFLPNPLPTTFTIPKFNELRQSDKWWYSRPFYVQVSGYRLGMFVFCNGVLDGKGTHVSVFLYLVKGEYDGDLEWPFRGSVVVHMLNQRGDYNHHQKVVRFTDDTPMAVCSRVLTGDMAKEGNGPTQFISHPNISYNADKDTEFLKNDCLKIRVTSFHGRSGGKGGTLPRNETSKNRTMEKSHSMDTHASTVHSHEEVAQSPITKSPTIREEGMEFPGSTDPPFSSSPSSESSDRREDEQLKKDEVTEAEPKKGEDSKSGSGKEDSTEDVEEKEESKEDSDGDKKAPGELDDLAALKEEMGKMQF